MSHPLKRKIGTLRGRVRRLAAVYGVSWVVGAVLAAVLLVGLADYLVRFQDRGIRVMASMVVLGVLGWTCYRHLYLGLRSVRLRDVDLAQRVQRRFPALGDGLASSVEFLDQPEDDPIAGSVTLRRAVIAKTTAETEPLDFGEVIERGPTVRAATGALALGLVAAIVVAVDPLSSQIAVARLSNPFDDVAWPQTTHLVLRRWVARVARGQAFEVEVVDRYGVKLPPQVRIHYRFEGSDGSTTEESELMHYIGDAMVARRENVTRPFSYRVEGGDDHSMPWIPVEVVEPPKLEALRVELVPPEYTGWPPETTDGQIRALVGTKVSAVAKSTKRLAAAALCLKDGRRIPGRLDEDGVTFTVPGDPATELTIEKSGAYWFELTDVEGLTAGSDTGWEIRALPDAPPTVSIEQPIATVFVTPNGVLPLRIAVKDDLAVHRIALRFNRSDRPEEDESVVLLQQGPDRVDPQAGGGLGAGEPSESRVVAYDWQLAPLELPPRTQVTFRGTATDYLPQTGTSEPRRLVIITPEELADRIASRQTSILADLARVLEMQRQSRRQVADLEIRLGEIGRLDRLDVDRLRGAELGQRQVNRTLTSRSEGVPMQIIGLLAELENNKVDSPDVQRQMEGLLAEIERLGREHLPIINRELTAAIKAATVRLQDAAAEEPSAAPEMEEDRPPGQHAAVREPLAAAGEEQDRVIASLEQMLGELSRWDNLRRFHRDFTQLEREEQDLLHRTTDLSSHSLAKELKDLLPQELADLRIVGRRQSELARRLDRIQQEMQQAVDQFEESDPLAAETVADALYRARELAISGQMRTAGGHVEQNRMGRAIEAQKQVIENLGEVLDILANRRQYELTRLIKKLRQAEADLAEIAGREAKVRKRTGEAAEAASETERRDQLQRVSGQQQQLEEETERMARRLERLMARQAGDTTRQAAGAMHQAGQSAGRGEAQKASEQAGEAERELDEAREQLAQRRRQAELELAIEQLARLEGTLKAMQARQEKALDETRRLDRIKQSQGRLTETETTSLYRLAQEQRNLKDETSVLIEEFVAAAVINMALSEAAAEMSRAAGLLDRRLTGRPTQQAEQQVLWRLAQLIEAVKQEELEATAQSGGGGQGGQAAQPQDVPPCDALKRLAELKLLRLMQEEINEQTRQLEKDFGSVDNLSEEARRQYTRLSEAQGRLADLLLSLVPPERKPEDNPNRDDRPLPPVEEEEMR